MEVLCSDQTKTTRTGARKRRNFVGSKNKEEDRPVVRDRAKRLKRDNAVFETSIGRLLDQQQVLLSQVKRQTACAKVQALKTCAELAGDQLDKRKWTKEMQRTVQLLLSDEEKEEKMDIISLYCEKISLKHSSN